MKADAFFRLVRSSDIKSVDIKEKFHRVTTHNGRRHRVAFAPSYAKIQQLLKHRVKVCFRSIPLPQARKPKKKAKHAPLKGRKELCYSKFIEHLNKGNIAWVAVLKGVYLINLQNLERYIVRGIVHPKVIALLKKKGVTFSPKGWVEKYIRK